MRLLFKIKLQKYYSFNVLKYVFLIISYRALSNFSYFLSLDDHMPEIIVLIFYLQYFINKSVFN